jgi:DSF synthase
MNAVAEFPALANTQNLRQIEVDYEPETSSLYWWMNPAPRPCFNSAFLAEVEQFESRLEQHQGWIKHEGRECLVKNVVFGSRIPGVFNLGGDLSMFIQAILRKDRGSLVQYGDLCVDNMFRRLSGFGVGIGTFSLVQGKAFGGGFECALASETIVAERSATMSFPEVLFNMFPGMGALSLLTRKIGLRKAEDIILSGQVYSAKEMLDLGVVDYLTDDGNGLEFTRAMIKARLRRSNSYRAMAAAKRAVNPVSHDEMRSVVQVWVDAAMRLEHRDLKMMARLVRAQDRLSALVSEDQIVEELFSTDERAVANG